MVDPTSNPPANKCQNWLQWMQTRDSATIINQSAQSKLFQTFGDAVSTEASKQALLNNSDTCFLFKDTFGKGKVKIFHHLTHIGGTICEVTETFGFIQGLESETAVFLTPDITTLLHQPQGGATQVPTPTSLLNVTSAQGIQDATVGTRTTIKPRNFIPIVPFAVKIIEETIRTKQGAAAEVCIATAKAIKDFDQNHNQDQDYTEKAKQTCKDLLSWLYLVAVDDNAITATPTTSCNNIMIIKKLKSLENDAFQKDNQAVSIPSSSSPETPTRDSGARDIQEKLIQPLEIIAASTASNQDFLRKLTQIQAASNDKSTKSFQKLPRKYRDMILNASSISGTTMVEVNPQSAEFFKSTSILNANIYLNSTLEEEQIDCSISSALTTSLYHGCFLWSNSLTPSGLACSVINSEDFMHSDTLYQGMVLDYSTKFEIKSDSLEKLTKTHVKFPTDMEGTIERIRALTALCKLFFGRKSFPAQGLSSLVLRCRENKRMMRAKAYLDPTFIPQFMCAIDNRLYHWLVQCSNASTVEETSTQLVNYSSLFDDIVMSRFHYSLPPAIKKIAPSKEISVFDTSFGSDRDTKRQKTVEQARNTAVPPEWKLKQGEDWDTIFKNKTLQGPDLSCGAKFCLKYWVKGLCYNDCRQKASHDKLNDADRKKGEAYIKQLRQA